MSVNYLHSERYRSQFCSQMSCYVSITSDELQVLGSYGDEESSGSADDNCSDTSSHKSYMIANPVGLTGLKNLGNTCYLNSAVQALSSCVPLTNYFLNAHAHTGDEKPPIAKYYHQMLSDIWSDKKLVCLLLLLLIAPLSSLRF